MSVQTVQVDQSETGIALRLLASVERVRPGLGFPILLLIASRLGAYLGTGRGLFVVGPMAIGKGASIEATTLEQRFSGWLIEAGEDLHTRWVSKALDRREVEGSPVSRLSIVFEDMAHLSGKKTKLERVLNLASWAVSNRRFADKSFHSKSERSEAHQFKSFHFVAGLTPRIYGQIIRLGPWDDSWRDRFTRLPIIRTAGDARRLQHYQRGPEVSTVQVRELINSYLPRELPPFVACELPKEDLEETREMLFGRQHTVTRGRQYLESDLKGLALLCGFDHVTQAHLELYKTALPYFYLGSLKPRMMAFLQHGLEGHQKRGMPLGVIAQRMGVSPRSLVAYLYEASTEGLIEYEKHPEGVHLSKVYPGYKLALNLNNMITLRKSGAALGASLGST